MQYLVKTVLISPVNDKILLLNYGQKVADVNRVSLQLANEDIYCPNLFVFFLFHCNVFSFALGTLGPWIEC